MEISARAETECEGGNRCFLYLLLYTKNPHVISPLERRKLAVRRELFNNVDARYL